MVARQAAGEAEGLDVTRRQRDRDRASLGAAIQLRAAAEHQPERLDLRPGAAIGRGESLGAERKWKCAILARFGEHDRQAARHRVGQVRQAEFVDIVYDCLARGGCFADVQRQRLERCCWYADMDDVDVGLRDAIGRMVDVGAIEVLERAIFTQCPAEHAGVAGRRRCSDREIEHAVQFGLHLADLWWREVALAGAVITDVGDGRRGRGGVGCRFADREGKRIGVLDHAGSDHEHSQRLAFGVAPARYQRRARHRVPAQEGVQRSDRLTRAHDGFAQRRVRVGPHDCGLRTDQRSQVPRPPQGDIGDERLPGIGNRSCDRRRHQRAPAKLRMQRGRVATCGDCRTGAQALHDQRPQLGVREQVADGFGVVAAGGGSRYRQQATMFERRVRGRAQRGGRPCRGIGRRCGVRRTGSQHSGDLVRRHHWIRIQRMRARVAGQVDRPRAEGIAATVAQPRQRAGPDLVANADWVDQIASGQARCVLNHLVTVVVTHALARAWRRQTPALPAKQRVVHVYRRLVDAGSLVRRATLREAGFRQTVEHLAEAFDGQMRQPLVQRCPTLDLIVPHLDAEAAGDIFGMQFRCAAVVEVRLEVFLPVKPLLDAQRLLRGGYGEAAGAHRRRGGVDRITVLLDLQQPRQRPQEPLGL